MNCTTRMFLLVPPTTYVFGTFFIIVSISASVGNILVLAILWLFGKRSQSDTILSSLAVSDMLVGLILSPITAWQLIDSCSLRNCTADLVRTYFAILLVGSSVMTLGVIAYDQYILLTKLTNYDNCMTRKKVILLLSIAWVFPGLVPILRLAGKYPYLFVVLIIFVGPLIVLVVSYCYITVAVKAKEQIVKNYQVTSSALNSLEDEGVSNACSNVKFAKDTEISSENLSRVKKERRHIKLAKTVAVLISCYVCCTTPLNIAIIISLIRTLHPFMSPASYQNIIYILYVGSSNEFML